MASVRAIGGPTLAALFGFFAFLPYPAIPVGGHSAVQIGNVLALAITVMALLTSWKNKPYFLFLLLLLPPSFGLLKIAVCGDGSLDLCFKSLVTMAVSGLALLATQYLAPRHSLALLCGIAWASLLHMTVGICQMYSFARGEFPFLFLYVNPAFLDVQENANTIARYIQRPFGIFPEPSAMSSSLAPWALFWIAEAFGLVRLRCKPTPAQRALFVVAALASLTLMILSRSGHAAITMAGAASFAAIWLVRSRATFRTYGAIVMVFGVLLPLLSWQLVQSIDERTIAAVPSDQSWDDRAGSLSDGYQLYTGRSLPSLVFGLGPGMLAPLMLSTTGYSASWSISLTYIYQAGVVGALFCCWMFYYLAKTWNRGGRSLVFTVICITWFVGVTITTSYDQLLPVWVALGWLTVWPEVCKRPRPYSYGDLPAAQGRLGITPRRLANSKPDRMRGTP